MTDENQSTKGKSVVVDYETDKSDGSSDGSRTVDSSVGGYDISLFLPANFDEGGCSKSSLATNIKTPEYLYV